MQFNLLTGNIAIVRLRDCSTNLGRWYIEPFYIKEPVGYQNMSSGQNLLPIHKDLLLVIN